MLPGVLVARARQRRHPIGPAAARTLRADLRTDPLRPAVRALPPSTDRCLQFQVRLCF
jgi:hypothetical protein